MKFLLDTNVISELRKGTHADPSVAAWAQSVDPRDLATSVLVLAEIRRGVELKQSKDPGQADRLDAWLAGMRQKLQDRVIPVDEAIADAWARLSVPNPLPFVDGLMAATALTRGLILVTRNTHDVAGTGTQLLNPFQGSDAQPAD
ncbi:type II toxin-antitoxin system VapC family toxin [Methylocystis sp.]|uniref:type II toxin-antitoxin system VapC family toxin n=1 Tax=Methylocystis sp. TaxID=1911079 RepID=UPI0025DDAB8F|nr:type II toxin-antitoxin system VapC family toxin [Methylocystis sp.]